jgi:tetrahydromethanopterin S-methyltransferase subunit G
MNGFNEFLEKLLEYEAEYKAVNGRELTTLEELKSFIRGKRVQKFGKRRASLKSLKGFSF